MLHQSSAARRQGITVALGLIACASEASGAETSSRSHQNVRLPVTYCAYELGSQLTVEAINNRNQVVGTAVLEGDRFQGFIWEWRQGVDLLGVAPGAMNSTANDINDRGRVVGESGGLYVWDAARGMRPFVALGGQSVSATHINDRGNIIGLSTTAAEESEHLYFRERNGDVLDLGTGKIPFGVDDSGRVGYSEQSQQPPPTSEVFIWDPQRGVRRLRGFPPERLVLPEALNDRGHIVGSIVRDDQLPHAMRWTPAKGLQELTAPDEPGFSHAADVNEWGMVVGYMEQGILIRPFVWHELSGLLDLTTLLDPTSPAVPQAEVIEPRALNDLGWIAINTGPRGGPYQRAYVLTPKLRGDGGCRLPPTPDG